jgi:hypothetical protein
LGEGEESRLPSPSGEGLGVRTKHLNTSTVQQLNNYTIQQFKKYKL